MVLTAGNIKRAKYSEKRKTFEATKCYIEITNTSMAIGAREYSVDSIKCFIGLARFGSSLATLTKFLVVFGDSGKFLLFEQNILSNLQDTPVFN